MSIQAQPKNLENLRNYLQKKNCKFDLKLFGQETFEFDSIHFDSRAALSLEKSVFICLKGANFDSHDLIAEIIKKKAKIIFCSSSAERKVKELLSSLSLLELSELSFALIFLEDTRLALSLVSSYLYQELLEKIKLIGVTGTNGKTTVTYLSAQLLSKLLLEPVALLGTTGFKVIDSSVNKDTKKEYSLGQGSGRTTAEAPETLEKISQISKEYGCKYFILEVSSHALVQKRVEPFVFEVAAFLNLTQDHLDYHQNLENYLQAKLLLTEITRGKFIVNLDDRSAPAFFKRLKEKKVPVSAFSTQKRDSLLKSNSCENLPDALLYTEEIIQTDYRIKAQVKFSSLSKSSQSFLLESENLQGKFNLANLLAAISICLALNLEFEPSSLLEASLNLEPAPGRFEIINPEDLKAGKIPRCIVDYAHTPDGLENLLQAAFEIKQAEKGRLICLFGCGGERDRGKRALMGQIALKYSDIIIVTSDNPRGEDPLAIIQEIIRDLKVSSGQKLEVLVERSQAIKRAIELSSLGDLVLVAGKGDENYQISGGKSRYFSDREEVIKSLSEFKPK